LQPRPRRPTRDAQAQSSGSANALAGAARSDIPSRGWFAAWAAVGIVAIVYVSVVATTAGINFRPLPLSEAWQLFLDTPYIALGSDQQPDWMANLLLLVPLAFLIAGAVSPRRVTALTWIAAFFAFLICFALVLAIKFAQLYFPPRTVTLNYIFAQSLGSLLGVSLFGLFHRRLYAFARSIRLGGPRSLEIALAVYAVVLFAYFLFPFDFAFTSVDLNARLGSLPQLLFAWPNADRGLGLRLVLLLASVATTAPLGMLIVLRSPKITLWRAATVGFVAMTGVCAATIFVISGTPTFITVVIRTIGIVAGAAIMQRWKPGNLAGWRAVASRRMPLLVPAYILAVLFVNDLLALRWRGVDDALAALDWRGMAPFWHYYMVSKTHGIASFVVHAAMFAPIGIMVWLRRGDGRMAMWLAMGLAFAFATLVEIGRWLRPELQPDISNIFVAVFAAGIAVKLMPSMLRMLSLPSDPGRSPLAAAAPQREPAPTRVAGDPSQKIGVFGKTASYAMAAALLALDAAMIARYPLLPGIMAAVVALYGICLWRWTGAWLLVLPAALPVFDLAPWAGWMYVGESDFLILATIAILAIRAPVRRQDLVPRGWPGALVALYVIAILASLAIGLALPGPAGGSDNPYLRPDNALRLAKALFAALLLWPFLRQRMRTHGDTMLRFAGGMIFGLALESVAVTVERALFPGLFDFVSDYRVVGTFSSMHFGGGHIGAYLAMAFPFLVVGLRKPRPTIFLAALAVALIAGYALVVTFARTAYIATLIGITVAVLSWALSTGCTHRVRAAAAILPILLPIMLGGILAFAMLDSAFMESRLGTIDQDLGTREANWAGGLASRDQTVANILFGTGLGTYPRVALSAASPTHAPSNLTVGHDGGAAFLSITSRSSFYLVQHVPVVPGLSYKLTAQIRSSRGPSQLGVALCENLLLYSENCRGTTQDVPAGTSWHDVSITVGSVDPGNTALWGLVRRPVILSVSNSMPASTIEIRNLQLIDARGHDVLANGDFSSGTERWFATDDDHLVWRMKNQYLMILFESGVLGLGAFLLLAGAALLQAIKAARDGNLVAAAIGGSIVAFLCSGVFDSLLEAPRIATLFYLVALLGLQTSRLRTTAAEDGGRAA
jgi:hypothetical protein